MDSLQARGDLPQSIHTQIEQYRKEVRSNRGWYWSSFIAILAGSGIMISSSLDLVAMMEDPYYNSYDGSQIVAAWMPKFLVGFGIYFGGAVVSGIMKNQLKEPPSNIMVSYNSFSSSIR